MIFYHVTSEENVLDIVENGFLPVQQEDDSRYARNENTLAGTDICGVYFFLDEYDAEGFLCDNNSDMDKVILKVEADVDYILDPEYSGEAVFVNTSEIILADLLKDLMLHNKKESLLKLSFLIFQMIEKY